MQVIFSTSQGTFISDGTAAGTTLITAQSLPNSSGYATITVPAQIGSEFVFGYQNGIVDQYEEFPDPPSLWLTDLTDTGTSAFITLPDDALGADNSPVVQEIISLGSVAVFEYSADPYFHQLWSTDGTASGTVDLSASTSDIDPTDFDAGSLLTSGRFVFPDSTGLAVTDGTVAGTFQLLPGTFGGDTYPVGLVSLGSIAVFTVSFGPDFIGSNQLWRSDGTQAGTVLVTNLPEVSADAGISSIAAFGTKVLFGYEDGSASYTSNLWVTDGTAAGTFELPGITYPEFGAIAGSRAILIAAEGLVSTDGTVAGTQVIAPKTLGPNGFGPTTIMATLGDDVIFAAAVPTSLNNPYSYGETNQLWETDGTAAGTQLIEVIPGGGSITSMTSVGDRVLFTYFDSANDEAVWTTDGTVSGTTKLIDNASAYFSSGDVTDISTVPIVISGGIANQTGSDVTPITPLSNVTISDPNFVQTDTVTVTLSTATDGTLSNLAGGSYNATTGVYTVAGSAAAVTAAIDGLQFDPTLEPASSGAQTTAFAIAVIDTLGQSATDTTASVVISSVDAQQTSIAGVYETTLGRLPDADGLAWWQAMFATGTSLATLQADLAYSAEAQGDINGLYKQILGRPVDPNGLAWWEQALGNGSSLLAVRGSLASSSEAQGDINTIYERVLGRPVDPNGLAWWQQALADGASLALVQAAIASSAESQGDINTLYEQILGRPVDSSGLAWWEEQALANGSSMATVRASIANSAEAQSDINTLYQQVLGRSVDPGGLAWWQQALADGASMASVRVTVAASAEAQGDINALYEQELGRSVDPGSLALCEQTLGNGSSLTTVTSNIATSSEASGDLTGAYQAVYDTAPNQSVVATLEGRLAASVALSAIETSLYGPLIYDTVPGQSITDQATVQPFGVAVVTDPNTGDTETATITLTNASGAATDANGVLAGTGLVHTGAGTYILTSSSDTGLTSALDALVFTPTAGQVPAGQSVTTNMAISVNDTVATGSDTVTSITATAADTSGDTIHLYTGAPLNFIYGSAGNDTFTEAAGPEVIDESVGPQGNDVVANFNVAQDFVQLSAAMFANYAAVEAAITNVNGSAVLHFNSADSLTLQGIDPGTLTSGNFSFV